MARLPDPVEAGLKGDAADLYAELKEKRGRIDGMYRAMLNHPALTRKVSALGSFFRFGGSVLPDAARELVILHVSARLGAGYEWVKHVGPARGAGLSDGLIEGLRLGDHTLLDPGQRALLAVADHALALSSIPEALQESVIADFGPDLGIEAVVEAVVLVGFYRCIAGVIACFDVPLPEGAQPPFPATSDT